jgi:hypothetical protein
MRHDELVEQITLAENVIRTIEDTGRQLTSSRTGWPLNIADVMWREHGDPLRSGVLRVYAVSPCWAPDRRSASAGSAAVSVSRMDCAVVYRSVPAPSAWVSKFECACRGV